MILLIAENLRSDFKEYGMKLVGHVRNMTSFIQTFANKGGHRRSIAMRGIEAWTMGSQMTFDLYPTINFKVCFMLTAVHLGLHFRSFIPVPEFEAFGHNLSRRGNTIWQ